MTRLQPLTPDREELGPQHGTATREQAPASCRCGAHWPLTAAGVAHCAGCHLTFTSVHSFDQHRTGHVDHRRCLTAAELTAAGWSANEYDRWRLPAPPDAAARIARLPELASSGTSHRPNT